MKTPKHQEKKKHKRATEKWSQNFYYFFIGSIVFGAVYYYFLQPITIGQDFRYDFYINVLPILIGLIVLVIFGRKYEPDLFSGIKSLKERLLVFIMLPLVGMVFSYLMLGQFVCMGWNLLNSHTAKQNKEQTITCPVTSFSTGRKPKIWFEFEGHTESLRTDRETINTFTNKKPEDYKVFIKAQKGIWNHYVVNSWTIKNNHAS